MKKFVEMNLDVLSKHWERFLILEVEASMVKEFYVITYPIGLQGGWIHKNKVRQTWEED